MTQIASGRPSRAVAGPRAPFTETPALCISIHDVAPATWALCQHLIATVEAVATVPLTFLVVPDYHRLAVTDRERGAYERALAHRLALGDELALHGYTHLDEAPRATGLRERYLREVFTTREGEFAALTESEAARRIALGLAWFDQRRWPVTGFVAPAWLLGPGSWQALAAYPFSYTTTARRVHMLRAGEVMDSPTMVYTARNAVGRLLSRRWNGHLASRLSSTPLIRLALHPADARHAGLMQHLQQLLGQLLHHRTAMTKARFVSRWTSAPRPDDWPPTRAGQAPNRVT